jgi:hypothetical protein
MVTRFIGRMEVRMVCVAAQAERAAETVRQVLTQMVPVA